MKNILIQIVTRLIISATLCIILISCDPAITYEYYLDNQSNKELKIKYQVSTYIDSTVTSFPKTKIPFYRINVLGSDPHDEGDQFLNQFNSLSFETVDSSKLILDYLERNNWKYARDINHLGLIKTGTNIYTLKLTNDDFE